MRFSPTKLLHGLRCTAPIILLTLAACGGGGGGSGGGGASTYSLSGKVTGVSAGGTVVLQNNGGDNKSVTFSTSATGFAFATRLANGASYNVTVLTQPTGPNQICTVTNATGTMSSAGVSNVTVNCTNAFPLNVPVIGLNGTGLVLRNNGGDDMPINSGSGTYTFNTPVANGTTYAVTVLSQPIAPSQNQICTFAGNTTGTMSPSGATTSTLNCVHAFTISGNTSTQLAGKMVLKNTINVTNVDYLAVAGSGATPFTFSTPLLSGDNYSVTVSNPPYGQDCTPSLNSGIVAADVVNVTITCGAAGTGAIPAVDRYAYAANIVSNDITAFKINSGDGSLGSQFTAMSGLDQPSSVVVHTVVGGNSYVYVTNHSSGGTGSISAYQINSSDGSLTAPSSIATGAGPYKISIHPTGKYAYVVNQNGNSISGYSIDAITGALAIMDTDGSLAATQAIIATGSYPIDIAIHPGGGYAYVVNQADNTVSAYSIDAHNGALKHISDIATGTAPASITIDPTGSYAYVANSGSASVSAYGINADGTLTRINADFSGGIPDLTVGTAPKVVTIDPSGKYAYVANSSSKTVSAYSIQSGGGLLAVSGAGSTVLTGGGLAANPISIRIDNSGTYLYVANYDTTSNILSFSISGANGALSPAGAIPVVSAGSNPNSIATAP